MRIRSERDGVGVLIRQLIRFSIVGVIATIVDFGILIGLTELFGVHYLVSAALAFICSVVVNYILSMRYVFRGRQDISKRREFSVFVTLSVIGLGLNEVLMWLGVDVAGLHYILIKIIATGIVMLYNFVTRKILLEDHTQCDSCSLNALPQPTAQPEHAASTHI
ncbi:MAG: GtrA family protein [Actinomycetaceae bacterium]|nr:GtrA family protein [Actinomycetaceae bacterium]